MTLIELVPYLHNPKQLYAEIALNRESKELQLYLKESLSLEAEVAIFEIEETNDEDFFVKDGITYVQLYPLDHSMDLVEFDSLEEDLDQSDVAAAKRLLADRLEHFGE